MNTNTTQGLSAKAINELRTIYEDEFNETLTDGEAEEMGMRLLLFWSILVTPALKPIDIQPAKQKQKVTNVSE